MKNLKLIKGNIFTSSCNTLVNTVNCVGIMGAGIALEFRLRYPKMFKEYKDLCEQNKISVGNLWLYKSNDKSILNFPTKFHWKYPSKEEYLHKGLAEFIRIYKDLNLDSVAFPLLGAQKGGIKPEKSLEIMSGYLNKVDIEIEIYQYDPVANDDLYQSFKSKFIDINDNNIQLQTGLRLQYIKLIKEALSNPKINQLNQLAKVNGIGDKTLEKAFAFMLNDESKKQYMQKDLF